MIELVAESGGGTNQAQSKGEKHSKQSTRHNQGSEVWGSLARSHASRSAPCAWSIGGLSRDGKWGEEPDHVRIVY